jgi:hypothetical protein
VAGGLCFWDHFRFCGCVTSLGWFFQAAAHLHAMLCGHGVALLISHIPLITRACMSTCAVAASSSSCTRIVADLLLGQRLYTKYIYCWADLFMRPRLQSHQLQAPLRDFDPCFGFLWASMKEVLMQG